MVSIWFSNAGLEPDMEKDSLIPFPCPFTIKIVGKKTPFLVSEIHTMVEKHFPPYDKTVFAIKESTKGNYLSISVTVFAENKKVLDDFYREASSHSDVQM